MLNVVPWSSALSTETRPPCSSTMALTTDRPSPVPGRPEVRALDARTNRWNSRSISSGGMPMPWSATSIRHWPLDQAARTQTVSPGWENLTALATRLSSTWVRPSGSARRSGPSPASAVSVTP